MDDSVTGRRAWLARWNADIEEETRLAESMFLPAPNHLTRDKPTKAYFVSVIMEEVGKLARATNKLSIIPLGADAAKEWHRDGQTRLRTCASLVRRMAELWPELPDERTGGPGR